MKGGFEDVTTKDMDSAALSLAESDDFQQRIADKLQVGGPGNYSGGALQCACWEGIGGPAPTAPPGH
jgi:hypothetical protein